MLNQQYWQFSLVEKKRHFCAKRHWRQCAGSTHKHAIRCTHPWSSGLFQLFFFHPPSPSSFFFLLIHHVVITVRINLFLVSCLCLGKLNSGYSANVGRLEGSSYYRSEGNWTKKNNCSSTSVAVSIGVFRRATLRHKFISGGDFLLIFLCAWHKKIARQKSLRHTYILNGKMARLACVM